uniref:CHAT domain-containing protein n=1 Tax=Macrostomum lignano TaxID=282301 RepID=A0A1I8JRJ0_9PLAT
GLENYLSRLGSLEHLSCVDCGLVCRTPDPGLLKLTHRLTHLDLSRNQYCPTAQAGHEHPAGLFNKFVRKPSITRRCVKWRGCGRRQRWSIAWTSGAELFAECRSLRLVRLNRCRLPAAAAESLLVGLSRCGGGGGGGDSAKPAELSVELAGNDFGVSGAQILWNCFNNYQMPQLESLDLSDNDFGAGTNPLVDSIRKSSVRHLSIGGNNFRGFAKKDQSMIQEFSELVTEDKCALFVNSSLVCCWQLDGNRIGAKGLRDIAESLRFNQTLLRLPVPVADVAASAGGSQQQQQLVQEALDLLQEGLVRNNQKVGRQVTAKDYRLHAELSNYQFTADNQIAVAATPETGRAEIDEHAERCRRAIKDAESAKRLLIRLQVDTDAPGGGSSGVAAAAATAPLPDRRTAGAVARAAALSADLDAAQSEMLRLAAAACPTSFAEDSGLADSLKAQLHGENSRCRIGLARVAEALSRSAGPALAAELSVLKLNSALVITTHLQEVAIRNLHQSTGLFELADPEQSIRANPAPQHGGVPVWPQQPGPPASPCFRLLINLRRRINIRLPDSPETLNEEDVEELSLSEDDWDPSKPTAALGAHPIGLSATKIDACQTSRKQPPAPVQRCRLWRRQLSGAAAEAAATDASDSEAPASDDDITDTPPTEGQSHRTPAITDTHRCQEDH